MKKSYIIFIGVIIFLIIISIIFIKSSSSTQSSNNEQKNRDQIQKISLSYKNYNYYPNTITVKKDIPVEITLDNSVRGCYRTLVIKEFGVNEYSADSSYTIKFTPNKEGTFEFSCGMRMGRGTINVE